MTDAFDGAALGSRIKRLRTLRRMSLDEVGQAAGLTKSHVWELEQGRSRNPTVNAVWGLARALSVSPAAILGLDDAMPPIHPLALQIAGMVDRALRTATADADAELRQALKPFAGMADSFQREGDFDLMLLIAEPGDIAHFSAEEFRRARSALNGEG